MKIFLVMRIFQWSSLDLRHAMSFIGKRMCIKMPLETCHRTVRITDNAQYDLNCVKGLQNTNTTTTNFLFHMFYESRILIIHELFFSKTQFPFNNDVNIIWKFGRKFLDNACCIDEFCSFHEYRMVETT